MSSVYPNPYVEGAKAIDLNELLFDHPAASFIFKIGNDLLVVDRALTPSDDSLVLVERPSGYRLEPYNGQRSWGVVTYRIARLTSTFGALVLIAANC